MSMWRLVVFMFTTVAAAACGTCYLVPRFLFGLNLANYVYTPCFVGRLAFVSIISHRIEMACLPKNGVQ